MIIKYTFKDNDFTQVIEQYLQEYGPFLIMVHNTIDDYSKFKEDIMKYDELERKDPRKQELKSKLTKALKEHFTRYINSIKENSNWHTEGMTAKDLIESKAYILENIQISIVNSITDKWQNGEVIYYITSNEKYLTM